MSEEKYTDTVSVLKGHILEAISALENAYGYHSANDLQGAYKAVKPTVAFSRLTKQISQAKETIQSYVQTEGDSDV